MKPSKYFKVPHGVEIKSESSNILKKLLIEIGKNTKIPKRQSELKRGISQIAKKVGCSKTSIKYLYMIKTKTLTTIRGVDCSLYTFYWSIEKSHCGWILQAILDYQPVFSQQIIEEINSYSIRKKTPSFSKRSLSNDIIIGLHSSLNNDDKANLVNRISNSSEIAMDLLKKIQ
jgi:hypothetical protein